MIVILSSTTTRIHLKGRKGDDKEKFHSKLIFIDKIILCDCAMFISEHVSIYVNGALYSMWHLENAIILRVDVRSNANINSSTEIKRHFSEAKILCGIRVTFPHDFSCFVVKLLQPRHLIPSYFISVVQQIFIQSSN